MAEYQNSGQWIPYIINHLNSLPFFIFTVHFLTLDGCYYSISPSVLLIYLLQQMVLLEVLDNLSLFMEECLLLRGHHSQIRLAFFAILYWS